MKYPFVLTEDDTIDTALCGRSLSRFGDGELRIAIGGHAKSQKADEKLAAELRNILANASKALVCIPNNNPKSPKAKNWMRYSTPQFTRLYTLQHYGSAFISRPDSAPWINRPDYWAKIKRLWLGLDTVLVTGEPEGSSKIRGIGDGAKTLLRITAPRTHAYEHINQIEEQIGQPSGPVILCLGATATALAVRLANKDVFALDLGHIGMFLTRMSITKPEGL